MFDLDFQVDSGLSGVTQTPTRTWSGLSHLEAQWLSVVADGVPQAPIQVIGGKVTLPYPVQTAQMGLPYAHVIEPLPPTTPDGATLMGRLRLIAVTLRLQETKALCLDTGNGLTAIPLGEPPHTFSVQPFSGDKRVGVLGWRKSGPDSLWRIEQDAPASFTLLSANAEISVSK